MKLSVFLFLIMFICSLASAVFAVQYDYTPFLRWGVGARPMGMGKAFSFVADDPNAVFYNPAGLGFLSGVQIEAQAGKEFYRVKNNYFAITSSNMGIGYSNYGSYTIPYWKTNGTYHEFPTEDSSLLLLSYAKMLSPSFSIGANLKSFLLGSTLGDASGKSIDIGMLVRSSDNWQWGIAVQDLISSIDTLTVKTLNPNVGPQTKADVFIYPNFKLGFLNRNDFFNLAGEVNNLGYCPEMNIGIEKWMPFLLESNFALRLGVYGKLSSYSADDSKNLTKSIGIGLQKDFVELDCAAELYPDNGTTFRWSVLFGLENAFLSHFSQIGMLPFFGDLSGPKEGKPALETISPTGTPPPIPPRPVSPPSTTPAQQDNTQQQQQGGLIINVQYNPLPHSQREGALSGQVTLAKLPERIQFSPTHGLIGKQSDFRRLTPLQEKNNAYLPLVTKRYSNILINRTGVPFPMEKIPYFLSSFNVGFPINTIRNLAAGRYMMEFAANNSTSWYGEVEILPSRYTTVNATIEPAYGNLTGKIFRPDGSPCRSLGVVTALGQRTTQNCNVDVNGNFQFTNLPSGGYSLRVHGNQAGDNYENYYLPKIALANIPTGYQTGSSIGVTLEPYISTGNIKGRILPVSALSGYRFGRLQRENLDIKTLRNGMAYQPEAVINFQTGGYNFYNKEKGPYQLDIRQVGGWLPPGYVDVAVSDMGRTTEVRTVTLEADPEYLPDLHVASGRLQRRRYGWEWLEYPFTSSVQPDNYYRIVAMIRNGGWAASPNFKAKIIQRKTTATAAYYTVLAETMLGSIEGLGAEATYNIDCGAITWAPNAINEIILKLDPYRYLNELDRNNNEAIVYKQGSIPTRDLRFYSPPEFYEVTPCHSGLPASAQLYTRQGNEQVLVPGDQIKLRVLVSGAYSGDQLVVYLNNEGLSSREVYRTNNLSQDYLANYLSFSYELDKPGKYWFTFVLVSSPAAQETNPNNQICETGKFYVLNSVSDSLIYGTASRGTLEYTHQPSTIDIKFYNKAASESPAGFVNYKAELLTADDLAIPITVESFPRIGVGSRQNPNCVTKTFNLPGGVFAKGYNRLALSYLEPNTGAIIKRSYIYKDCNINPIYTTPQDGIQPVLLGVPININNFTVQPVIRHGYHCQYRIMKNAIGLGASASDWLGETNRIDGYITKTIRVDSGNGIVYNTLYPATEIRKKHLVYPVLVLNYAGVLDSAALAQSVPFLSPLIPVPTGDSANTEENQDFGVESYEVKIDYDFIDGTVSATDPGMNVSNNGSVFNTSRNTVYPAIGGKLFELSLDLLPLGSTVGAPIKSAFIAYGIEAEMADEIAGDIVGEIIQAAADEILASEEREINNTLINLDAREPVLGDKLFFYRNKRLEEGNFYTLCVSASVSAGCMGLAWSVADFCGFYSKEGHEFFYNRFKRGIWVKAARLQF